MKNFYLSVGAILALAGGAYAQQNSLHGLSTNRNTDELPEKFSNGFFIINEDWGGHAMGSINWIDSEGNLCYNVDNKANDNTEVLGATSEYGQIYGGYFEALATWDDRTWILNLIDNSNAKIIVYGGTFVNYDPSNSATENPEMNFVAEGYKVVMTTDGATGNKIYTVVPEE